MRSQLYQVPESTKSNIKLWTLYSMSLFRASGSTRGPRIHDLWSTKETQAFGREQVSIVLMVCCNRCWFFTFMGNWLRPNILSLSSSKKKEKPGRDGADRLPRAPNGCKNEVSANPGTRLGSSTRCLSWGRGRWRRGRRVSVKEIS